MKKIGIDGRYAQGDLVGIGNYIEHLVYGLSKRYFKVIVFYSEEPKNPLKGKNITPVVVNSSNPFSFEQIKLPKLVKKYKIDLFHAVGNMGLGSFLKVPTILTVHDLIPLKDTKYFSNSLFPLFSKASYTLRILSSLHKANKIIAVSKAAKKDIENKFFISSYKIEVIYSGKNFNNTTKSTEFDLKTKKYFIHNGGMEKRKNIELLMGAFKQVNLKNPQYKLVITGNINNYAKKLQQLAKDLEISDKVIFTGYIEKEKLSYLLKNTAAVCYPSLYEGFGFPVLEGFAAGVPVIASNIPSIVEISQGAATLVEPNSPAQMINAMNSVASGSTNINDKVKKGFSVAKKYSWEKFIKETIEVYKEVLK